jgi:zinc D-Ala-D-Ala carboxypeptidase
MKWYWWIAIALAVLGLGGFFNRKRVMEDLSNIKLSENFNLSEFVKTSTGFDNIPPPEVVEQLRLLVKNILQPLRTHLNKPIKITSGYRSPLVNANVEGSSKTSQHMKGQAADFQVSGMTNQQLIDIIRQLRLPYDQVIDEQRGSSLWVHVSFNPNGVRGQWLTRRDPGPGREREYELIKVG